MKQLILMAALAFGTAMGGSAAMAGETEFDHLWQEPARGTQTRKDLMSAIRPIAEWKLGAPVQFVVQELRVSGDVAFAMLQAQRPGGAQIDLVNTPANQRGELYIEDMDGARFDVLFKKSGNMWVAVDWSLGATDAWWAWKPHCDFFAPVIADFCAYVE